MKKFSVVLLSIFLFINIISCASFSPKLVKDGFYENNNYFTSGDYLIIANTGIIEPVGVLYRTDNGTSNIKMKVKYKDFSTSGKYSIAIKYEDGSIEKFYPLDVEFKYDNNYKRYYYNVYFSTPTVIKHKNIDSLRIVRDNYYNNVEVSEYKNEQLAEIFTNMQNTVDNYYKISNK